jgi:hypothetical protein
MADKTADVAALRKTGYAVEGKAAMGGVTPGLSVLPTRRGLANT